MNYVLLLAYDGTAYHGWQIQPDKATIAGTLQAVFASLFRTDVSLIAASRTDAGVHALGQVVLASTSLDLEPDRIRKAWNACLPRDIHIRALRASPAPFNPFTGVIQKTYYYHFFLERPLPFVARYGTTWHRPFNLAVMRDSLSIFVGTHNFRSFCTGDEQQSTTRTIDSIELVYLKRFNLYRIIIKGPGFLRYMIRRIVGAAAHCATHPFYSPDQLINALAECDPHQQLPTAKPQGLLLRKIQYENFYW